MATRLPEKIKEVEDFLGQLADYTPASLEAYLANPKDRAACERLFEKIVEAVIDICFLIVRQKGLGIPEDDREVFTLLERKKMIDAELSRKLKEAKGMRNILAHEYGKINDELVYHSLRNEIIPDTEKFLKQIEEYSGKKRSHERGEHAPNAV